MTKRNRKLSDDPISENVLYLILQLLFGLIWIAILIMNLRYDWQASPLPYRDPNSAGANYYAAQVKRLQNNAPVLRRDILHSAYFFWKWNGIYPYYQMVKDSSGGETLAISKYVFNDDIRYAREEDEITNVSHQMRIKVTAVYDSWTETTTIHHLLLYNPENKKNREIEVIADKSFTGSKELTGEEAIQILTNWGFHQALDF